MNTCLFDLLYVIRRRSNHAILSIKRETIIHEPSSHHIRIRVEEACTEGGTDSIVLVDQILMIFAKSLVFEVT